MGIKNAEFAADFESVKKVAKSMQKNYQRKSTKKGVFDCLQNFSACIFFWLNFLHFLQWIRAQHQILRCMNPYRIFEKTVLLISAFC